MQLIESSIKVYFTKEYGLFRTMLGNRALNEKRINSIIKDIKGGIDVLAFFPIVVRQKNDTLEILDGQHRFWVAKTLKMPVHFIINTSGLQVMDVARINMNQEKWKSKDFINSFIQIGNKDYEILNDFSDKWGLPITTSRILLERGLSIKDSGGYGGEKLNSGLFEVKYQHDAEMIMNHVIKFKSFKFYKRRDFIMAIIYLLIKGYSDDFIDKLAKKHDDNPGILASNSSMKDFVCNLQILYNKGREGHERFI